MPEFTLHDVRRAPHPTPCPDCGRTYLNGEGITWTVPDPDGGQRTVWSGCVDCWIRRTNPGEARVEDAPPPRYDPLPDPVIRQKES